MSAVFSTAKDRALMGVLHTTWHTLTNGMPYVTRAAREGWERVDKGGMISTHTHTAALMRKVMPANGNYEKAGWSKFQVGSIW